ncbi:uncharacterized protein LOC134035574 [Osmerus eperlanus]|uniref:uncharacterized protein LOC134035574 n=1 Tax=Osmerus eperlanus TaxID=29151 RepID=UPI002E13F2B6
MEKDKKDSSQPGVNEGREGSLSGDKGTFIRVLTVRPLSLEDMDLLVEASDLPAPSVPATGSKDQLEALEVASTSQGVSGVERMPPSTASSSTTSGSQRAMKTACSSALSSHTKLPISVISAVLQLINNRLPDMLPRLDASRDVPDTQTCSTSAAGLLSQEMLTKVSSMLQADTESQVALSRQSGTPSPDLQVEAKASLGSVAAEVIVPVIGNILAARAAIQEEAQEAVTVSSVSYFLSAVCADVQTLPLLRRSGSSSRSSGRSLGELLTTMSRTNVVQAVEQKLEEQFGPCRKERSSTSPSSQSRTEDLIMIPYLGSGRSGHSLASDLVDGIIGSVKSAVELLDIQSSSSRAGNSSSLTGWDALDVSSEVKKMVCKAAAILTPLVSSSRMGDVTADESVSLMNETSLESLPPSLIRLLLIRSVDTVTAACRAISSEFCYRESVKNEGLTKLQQLANEQMLACLNKAVEELEIDELVEGISAILDHSLILRRPEMSFSHIYRSLFVDSLLPGSGHRTTEVLETLIFLRPEGPPAAGQSLAHDTRVGTIIKEYVTKGKDVFQQALRRATQKLSRQPATPRGSPHAANPESSERPSLLVSSENCENLLGAILDDLHEVVEQHKASAKARSGGMKFWEQVHSSSQQLYDSTLRTLQKAADKLSALEERVSEIIPPKASFSWTKRTLGVILSAMRAEVAASECSTAELKRSEDGLLTCALLDSILENLSQLCEDEEGPTVSNATVGLDSAGLDELQIKTASESLLANVRRLRRQTATTGLHLQSPVSSTRSTSELMLPESPPMPSRQELIHSYAESSVKSQLQKSLELNLPSTSSLACQETLDRTVRILTERVMDTLCESAAAAPCPGEDLGELSPAAVIMDAGTASTSAGETRKAKKGLKWWSLPKKAKLFKNKFLNRKTEPKKPSAQEELPPSSHVTPGTKCGSPANLELSKDHETKQEPPRHPLHVRMFRALRKSIAKTFKMSGSQ